MMRVLLIDNYDSFTYNLAQQILNYTSSLEIFRNDQISIEEILANQFTHVVISPGPGHPTNHDDFGVNLSILQYMPSHIPILGVCLGHQGMAAYFGGHITHIPQVMHGKTSVIAHDGHGLFAGIKSPMQVMRYHSLCVDPNTFPNHLHITAQALDDHVIMAFEHIHLPRYGIQFHPESIATPQGEIIIKNFLMLTSTMHP